MNKPRSANRSERGQVIVLIVLAVVGLFGFGALALDGGQMYYNHRSAQAAADAAALAAAYDFVGAAQGSLTDAQLRARAKTVALSVAETNGFDNNGLTNYVSFVNPPLVDSYCGACGEEEAKEYFQVKITVKLKPIFAHFVYKGAEQVTASAIAHAKKPETASTGDALVSLSTDSDSFEFDGNTSAYVDGGNMRSFGGMVKNGASGKIRVTNGFVYHTTGFSGHTGPFGTNGPQVDKSFGISNFTAPYCPTATERVGWTNITVVKGKKTETTTAVTGTLNGTQYYYYPSGLSSDFQTLGAGIHCVEGGIGKGNYTGDDVLIVLLSGELKQTGGDSLNIKAANSIADAKGNKFSGLVLYAPKANTSDLELGGNASVYLQGSVYAPGSLCKVGGTSGSAAYHTSIICDKIKIHGTPDLKIIYKASELFRLPPFVALVQ